MVKAQNIPGTTKSQAGKTTIALGQSEGRILTGAAARHTQLRDALKPLASGGEVKVVKVHKAHSHGIANAVARALGADSKSHGWESIVSDLAEEQPITMVMDDLAAPDMAHQLWIMNPLLRIGVVKDGIPAAAVTSIAKRMEMPVERAYKALGLPSSTMARRVKTNDLLAPEQSERVLQMVRLVGLVEEIVQNTVSPEAADQFDAAKWLGEWIDRPQPSLGMRCPSEYLDTATGIEVVETLLKRIAVGAFA